MNKEYVVRLCERLSFPAEATEYFWGCVEVINENALASMLMDETLIAFEASGWSNDGIKHRFPRIAEVSGLNEYTVCMLFLLEACRDLERRYAEAGYSEQLFIDTMSDMRFKLLECKEVKGVWGTFVVTWYPGFFNMTRFALGRFQFEKREFSHELYGAGGHYLRKGDTVLNFHIPSSGVPLTDEVRYDSYRRAREFFFPDSDKPCAFVCSSWLLYPGYEEYIPDRLNIKRFRHDFTVLSYNESDSFGNGWRVFGGKADLPASELPRDTTQRRVFADYCEKGGKHGGGYGVFFFDGEKIVK